MKTSIVPHYFLYKTQDWLVFPHELAGITSEEIQQHKEKEILPLFNPGRKL